MIYIVLFVVFMLAPKVDLFPLPAGTFRAEDAIWLVALCFFFIRMIRSSHVTVPVYLRLFLAYLAVSAISALIGILGGRVESVLYWARQTQYVCWAFFVISSDDIRKTDVQRAINVVSWALILWGILELLDLIPKIGKFVGATNRLSLNTSGPFEAGVVLSLLVFCTKSTVQQLLLVTLTLLTQARITIVALAGVWAAIWPRRVLIFSILFAISFSVIPTVQSQVVSSRFSELPAPADLASSTALIWDAAPIVQSEEEYFFAAGYGSQGARVLERQLDRTDLDESVEIRLLRWAIIMKSAFSDVRLFLTGLGMGAFGVAVDNNYIRTFGESGALGLGLFVCFGIAILRRFDKSYASSSMFIVIAVTALFIDVFWSSKAMTFFWFVSSVELMHGPLMAPERDPSNARGSQSGRVRWRQTKHYRQPPRPSPATRLGD